MNNIKISKIAISLGVILCGLVLWWGCKETETGNSNNGSGQEQYKIIKGACGEVIYQEKIGTNFETGYNELLKRESDYFSKSCPNVPCYEVEFDYYEIEVVDKNNVKPGEQFFAIRVLDKSTKMLLHSVSEVITSNENLYQISWCPD